MFKLFIYILQRELTIFSRNKIEYLIPSLFFLLIITIFPLAIGHEEKLLKSIAPAIIWIAVLLSSLLCLDNLFKLDHDLGIFEQFTLSTYPLALIIFFKTITHWLLNILPLLLILPLLALFYNLDFQILKIILVTLLLGTPTLFFIGAFATALTISLPRSNILVFVIILPIYVPILIFATLAIIQAAQGLSSVGYLALLSALSLAAITFVPFAIAMAIKLGD